jgi:hypothetical protein
MKNRIKKTNIKTTKISKKNINKNHKIAYTEKELIDIFNWDPLLNEEWNGFHIASSISALPAGKIKKRTKQAI